MENRWSPGFWMRSSMISDMEILLQNQTWICTPLVFSIRPPLLCLHDVWERNDAGWPLGSEQTLQCWNVTTCLTFECFRTLTLLNTINYLWCFTVYFTCMLSPGPELSASTLCLRGRVSTSLIASMLTSFGSTANSEVTYMMMDFLSGNCTATSEAKEASQQEAGG